jgi:GNAT superfamily N-acetyltransferase
MTSVRFDNSVLSGEAFLALVQRVWPGDYDVDRVAEALRRTINLSAWHGDRLVGVLRVLSDNYLFATIPEILVDPEYQRQGIGRELMRRALDYAPRGKLFFGAQPQSVGFFEHIGCERGPIGFVAVRSSSSSPEP